MFDMYSKYARELIREHVTELVGRMPNDSLAMLLRDVFSETGAGLSYIAIYASDVVLKEAESRVGSAARRREADLWKAFNKKHNIDGIVSDQVFRDTVRAIPEDEFPPRFHVIIVEELLAAHGGDS